MKRTITAAVLALALLAGCTGDPQADVASRNLSTAADNFEVARHIVFFNGITDEYLLEVTGFCSVTADGLDDQLEVTCRNNDGTFIKHFLGLSDNVSYFVEQVTGIDVSTDFYRVIYRPQTLIPNIDLGG